MPKAYFRFDPTAVYQAKARKKYGSTFHCHSLAIE
jgi:hypothetical protein